MGTAYDATVSASGTDTEVHPTAATGTGTAYDATVETETGGDALPGWIKAHQFGPQGWAFAGCARGYGVIHDVKVEIDDDETVIALLLV
jgi:hypothetical protein